MKYYNIPIFVPHIGCPFDCVFCNQKHITGKSSDVDENTIKSTIEEYLKTLPKNGEDCRIEAAFFGGSFTGIDFDMQGRFLSIAYEYVKSGEISGIRLSTRPDYIDTKILDQLAEYGVTTIELGVQSLDEEVLKASNRGHTKECVKDAVSLIRQYDFSLGLQMMTGLPRDTEEKSINTAKEIIMLKPDFVRIYPTLVVKDTQLEYMYKSGEYVPQKLEDAVTLCKKLLLMFKAANINVIRVSLQTTDEISPDGSLVAGPFDFQFRELVEAEIFYDRFYDELKKKQYKSAVFYVNKRDISKAVGQKRKNVIKLSHEFGIEIKIKEDFRVKQGDFIISENTESEGQYCISND